MMKEAQFWTIIDKVSAKCPLQEDLIGYDDALNMELSKSNIDTLVSFQLRLESLRNNLDINSIRQVADALDYNPSTEVFNRFCNGIVASGKVFYENAKNDKNFLPHLLEKHPEQLSYCYYEAFSLVAKGIFYEKTNYEGDWLEAVKQYQRKQQLDKSAQQDLGIEQEL